MIPGETPFTRIPKEAYSMASDRVAAASPPFVSAVSTAGVLELATSARASVTLTTSPPFLGGVRPAGVLELATAARVSVTLTTGPPYRLAISAMARWVTQKNPVRLTPTAAA